MSSNLMLKALLSKGYFPRELPIAFTTSDFGTHSHDIIQDWEKSKIFTRDKNLGKHRTTKKKLTGGYLYSLKSSELEVISKPKKGYERRNVHITHPIPQALLSYEITNNWKSIQKWLSRQTFSEDEVVIGNQYERAIRGINFPFHHAKKAYLEATSDWIVKTDIARFYPTIYTHSVPWAAYGKEKVKANLKLYDGSLADRIDCLLRACNRNQTIGIPIGPETSRIIAEVISSRIDNSFVEKMRGIAAAKIDRLQDDWFVGTQTMESAEDVISLITSLYRDYGLDINGSKTSIGHISKAHDTHWTAELGAFISHRPGPMKGKRLKEFLSVTLRLQAQYPNESVVNYALSVIESQIEEATDVEMIESFLLRAASVSPGSMDHVCRILINLQHRTGRVSLQRIGTRFNQLIARNLERRNLFEVIWLIYTLRGLKKPLVCEKLSEALEGNPSSALALLLLDMKSRGLCVSRLPISKWESQITEESIVTEPVWLLAYEGIRHGWLRDATGVMGKAFFKPMNDRNVVFYDPKRNIPTSSSFKKRVTINRKRQLSAVKKFIQQLRGVSVMDVFPSDY